MMNPTFSSRLRGGLYGLLVGDACGVPYEFKSPDRLPTLDEIDMEPPRGFDRTYVGLPVGTWSDDGALALCLLSSLVECGGWNPHDCGQKFVSWQDEGYMAVGGHIFDIGIATSSALRRICSGTSALEAGGRGESDNGNGSLMRALPVSLWALKNGASEEETARIAMEQSVLTHAHPRSQLCCALYCGWAFHIGRGEDAERAWRLATEKTRAIVEKMPDSTLWRREMEEQIRPESEPKGTGSGYVVDCLHSARLVLREASTYEEAVKRSIALGHDTDTTACVAGGIAGMLWGEEAIPSRWMEALRQKETPDELLLSLGA
jgi:ADP-ribosyl-[dinitrogen reductase] hydrolase